MLHVIGDSHVSVFTGRPGITAHWPHRDVCGDVAVYHVGPHLAWTISDRVPLIEEILSKYAAQKDSTLLVFGEIDARMWLVRRHLERGTSVAQEAEACANQYMAIVRRLAAKIRPIKLAVYGPPANPPWEIDGPYPTIGSCDQRNEATRKFNERCRKLCEEDDLPFVSVFHLMFNPDGSPKKECYMDVIHLDPKTMYAPLRVMLRAAGLVEA
jgi:hypothetical protein